MTPFPVGFAEDPTFKVESVFLSKRKGALLVSLARDGATLDERGQWFAQESTARATALALITQAMHDACEIYGASPAEAQAILRPALARFEADAAALAAEDLPVEVDLAQDLLRLFELGAPQGTLY